MLPRSLTLPQRVHSSEARECDAEQQERARLRHDKVNGRGAAVQHTDREGGVARIRYLYKVSVKRCIDHLDQVIRLCREESAFASRRLEGLHEVTDAANPRCRAEGELARNQRAGGQRDVIRRAGGAGVGETDARQRGTGRPSLLPGSNISIICPLR